MERCLNSELMGCVRLFAAIFELLARDREIVPLLDEPYELRQTKTPAEHLSSTRRTASQQRGVEPAVETLQPGVAEREVAAAAECAMRHAGAEGFGIDTMVASGVANTRPILARSTFKRIEAGDLVAVTLAPRYEGYHAAIARPFLFRHNVPVEHAIRVARDAQRAAETALRAGSEGRKAEVASRAVVARGDTGAEFPYVGIHSIGVVEFEPPIFASTSSARVKDDMAISIDVPLFNARWGGLRIEDGFAIADGQAVPRLQHYQDIVPVMLA
jgi:Xaa-Pro dipeptidase